LSFNQKRGKKRNCTKIFGNQGVGKFKKEPVELTPWVVGFSTGKEKWRKFQGEVEKS